MTSLYTFTMYILPLENTITVYIHEINHYPREWLVFQLLIYVQYTLAGR